MHSDNHHMKFSGIKIAFMFCALVLVVSSFGGHCAGSDPPEPIGAIAFVIRSFQGGQDSQIQSIDRISIVASKIEVEYSPTLGGTTKIITVDNQPRPIIIQNFSITDRIIGQFQVPPGYVYMIRIYPSEVNIIQKTGSTISLKVPSPNIPSWGQSGWKIESTNGLPWQITQDLLTGIRILFRFDDLVQYNKGIGYQIRPSAPAEQFEVYPPAEKAGIVPDEITVFFQPSVSIAQINVINSGINAKIVVSSRYYQLHRMKLPSSITLEDAAAYYKSKPDVEIVLPAINLQVHGADNPNEGVQGTQNLANLPAAWRRVCDSSPLCVSPKPNLPLPVGNRKVNVAIIDTGINIAHPDLYQNIAINFKAIPRGFRTKLIDTDGDNVISMIDINATENSAYRPADYNNNHYADAEDILHDSAWSNGTDDDEDDNNGEIDDLVGINTAVANPIKGHSNNPISSIGPENYQHGTWVAGVLGGVGDNGLGVAGTAWAVSIVPIRATDADGKITDVAMWDALTYAEKIGADIANISLGETDASDKANFDCAAKGTTVVVPDADFQKVARDFPGSFKKAPWYDIATKTVTSKVLYVFSAGNDKVNLDNSLTYLVHAQPMKTVLGNNVLIVGSSKDNSSNSIESNYGALIELWAPGNAWRTINVDPSSGTVLVHGTSFAAPAVAGTAALILAKDTALLATSIPPTFKPNALYQRLLGTAQNTINVDAGCGLAQSNRPRLDADAATQ
jgi:subtilisin family serine protease